MIIRLTVASWDAVSEDAQIRTEALQGFDDVDGWLHNHHDMRWTITPDGERHVCESCWCPIDEQEHCYEGRFADSRFQRLCLNCVADAAMAAGVLTSIPRAWIESE